MTTERMQPYAYPDSPNQRLHGPAGYTNYSSYREWLRDDFLFRCVYCLHREKWGKHRGLWHIDHWQPQVEHKDKILKYENLLYACSTCNTSKGKRSVPNPCECMLDDAVEVYEDGTITPRTSEAERTIILLGLDSPEDVEYRSQIIGIYQLRKTNYALFFKWMGYPDNLPNLETKNKFCPENSRPEGIRESCYALRERGELPDYY